MFTASKHLRSVVMAAFALLIAACTPAGVSAPASPPATAGAPAQAARMTFAKNADGYADISVEQLAGMLPKKDFVLINTHVPYEGEIAQTDLFIAYDQIGDQLEALPAKDAPIVLYCRSGNMSTDAAKTLAGLGYANVMEVDGGFTDWKAAGYEVLHKP